MRVFLLFGLLLWVASCTQQRGEEDQSNFAFDTATVISVNFDSLRKRDIEMARMYADSLNQWTSGILPKFLERDIESEAQNLSEDVHHLRSFRKIVFDQVHNQKALEAILESKNERYSGLGQISRIPYSSLSIRDLTKMRYEELKSQ
jgi:hypothetical protein